MATRRALRRLSTSTAFSSDGTRIAWRSTPGDAAAPPIVLLNGWAGVAADWAAVAPRLAGVLLLRRGHGQRLGLRRGDQTEGDWNGFAEGAGADLTSQIQSTVFRFVRLRRFLKSGLTHLRF